MYKTESSNRKGSENNRDYPTTIRWTQEEAVEVHSAKKDLDREWRAIGIPNINPKTDLKILEEVTA